METETGEAGKDDRPLPGEAPIYCIVPQHLAAKLYEPLIHFFAADPRVEVVVESRWRGAGGRRSGAERRTVARSVLNDRRRINNAAGRRVGERRANYVAIDPPALPRKAQRHAGELAFWERIVPSAQRLEDLDTARLVIRVQAGEEAAFTAIYERYLARVFAYLQVALHDIHEAEDATQQVFVQVFESLHGYQLRPAAPFRAWLFRIARNHCLNRLRASARLEFADPAGLDEHRDLNGEHDAEPASMSWISDQALVVLIGQLPQAQRQALVMRYMLDLSAGQIASILEKSPAAVRKLQHQAIAFLRQRLTALGRAPLKEQPPYSVYHRPRQATVARERRFALLRY